MFKKFLSFALTVGCRCRCRRVLLHFRVLALLIRVAFLKFREIRLR